jgi:CubicO group peptidase (beta-lactamase class C family)
MKQFLTTILALIFAVSSYGQQILDADITQKIDSYLTALEEVGFYGAVLVELNGEPVISNGFGFSNTAEQIRNTPATIFDIGSITKQFTATAILKLEMQGKLSTDDSLSKFFAGVPADKAFITIHDLLRHQSGLISNVGKDYEKISNEEFLDKVFASNLRFETGTNFSYSNIGYSLLAMIIEMVSNQDYETYLYENLWKPANMEMTGYTRPDFDSNLIAVGYYRDGRVWGKPSEKEWGENSPYWHLKGNGGILSTTEDLYKWHKALMTEQILSNDALQKLYHPKLRAEETAAPYYAYGWDISKTTRNTTRVWHNGGNNILYADFLRFVDEQITMIMLSNKSHPNFDHLNFEIAKIIFNPAFKPEIPAMDNPENRNFTESIILTIEQFGLDSAKTVYEQRKTSESLLQFMMRNEGFNRMDANPDMTIQIFEMNVFAYPNSAIALQDLGEGYMETGENELALKYFKESLSINPDNPFAENMIKRLEE